GRSGGEAGRRGPGHPAGPARLAEVAAGLDCDLVVNVQGDEPLIEPRSIDEAIEPFATDAALVMSTLAVRLADTTDINDPNVVKVVSEQNGRALYFSRAPVPFRRTPRDDSA